MSDGSDPKGSIGSNRAARAAMREQLRRELTQGRAALRIERDAAASAAAHRTRRWRPARPDGTAPTALAIVVEADASVGEPGEAQPDPAAEHDGTTVAAAPDATLEVPPDTVPDAPPRAADSVFATLMGDMAEHREVVPHQVPPAAPPVPEKAPEVAAAPPDIAPATAAVEPVDTVTALGPGMLARLRLLGYAQITDLANADAAELRAGLGDISRLLNVEGWITEARRTLGR